MTYDNQNLLTPDPASQIFFCEGMSGDLLMYERQRYDGWYNNMANPDWGSVDSRLARKTPAHYEDGVYMMAETNR